MSGDRSHRIPLQWLLGSSLGAAGFLIGYGAIVIKSGGAAREFSQTPGFTIWAALVGAETAFWAVAALPLWRWYKEVRTDFGVAGHVWMRVFSSIAFMGALLLPVGVNPDVVFESALDYHRIRILLLAVIALLVALPGVLGIQAVQIAAKQKSWWRSGTQQHKMFERYQKLSQRLRGFLAMIGGMITFLVVSTGALFRAVGAFKPNETLPSEYTLLYGALFTVGLAAIYLPAFGALQQTGRRIIDSVCQLPEARADDFLTAVDKRARLATMLNIDGTARHNLENAVLVSTPLLAGITSGFIQAPS